MSAMPTGDVLWPNWVIVGGGEEAGCAEQARLRRQTLEPEERLLELLERREREARVGEQRAG